MNEISIIKKFKKQNYSSYPFPFFEIENAYDEKTYSLLRKDYNLFHSFFKKDKKYKDNNIRLQISSKEFLSNSLFTKIYPDIVKIVENEKNNSNFLGLREKENNENYIFVSDCQPGINTPTNFKSSVRDSHVDNPVELLAGLFYLKDEEDKTIGGDLEIMENIERKPLLFHDKAEVYNKSDLKVFKLIKYQKNKVVFLLIQKIPYTELHQGKVVNYQEI